MRGGKREGSGRKKREPTVVMRVPESLGELIKALIEDHKENEASSENQISLLDNRVSVGPAFFHALSTSGSRTFESN